MTLNLVISVLVPKYKPDVFPHIYLKNVSCRSEILSFQNKAGEGGDGTNKAEGGVGNPNLLRF